ncbi:MAG: diphosphomevalonate decarboxylase, partial [Endozoicomonadaceae bacterium]|nr:diphosphomevalonate decarboxylase [Endozoicomonadaceae bacterium]
QWSVQVAEDILQLEQAISQQDFELLGRTAEHNAMSMHATMLSAWPPLCYWIPDSIAVLHQVWSLRKEGLDIYVTMDAGPNIKLLFEQQDEKKIRQFFPSAEICCLF